ncbi:hypothetical protein OYE22_19800 [Streptomyces sp. 71268]|uniref:hypothetical protein n=1 Tax=Streptomyces sp. 71268 TaxID=3002640 RepID=UPI0023F8F96A|nr:hypothetical protein [Streptomyces sp. 71268]WEV27191.1 hypothetical protein OYE22_19800 [Streptomyces sp. 71268]
MSFQEEWGQIRSEAATRTRLNSAGGGDADRLVVHQEDLGRVGHEAFLLHGRLKKAGDIARGAAGEGSTAKAAATLTSHNFTLGEALTTMSAIWDDQVKTLLQSCAHISNHLDFSKKSHTREDKEIAATMSHRDGSAMTASEIAQYYR